MLAVGSHGMIEATITSNGGAPRPIILIIDPDGDYLADCIMPLLQAGFDVLIAMNHQEVHYICDLFPRAIDLVLLDVPLDRHTRIEGRRWRDYGSQLVTLLRMKRPSIKILLTSSTPGWKLSRQRLGAVLWQFPLLSHPCPKAQLLDRIHTMLMAQPSDHSAQTDLLLQCA